MTLAAAIVAGVLTLTYLAWRQYLWAATESAREPRDTCPYSLTDTFGGCQYDKVPHQEGARWLSDIFSRSAARFPGLPALQIAHSGETLTYAELDVLAERVASAVTPFLTGPDQVVAVCMPQDNVLIVAAHLGVIRAGGTLVVLDTTLPDGLLEHMLDDARPVLVLTLGESDFRGLPTLDLSKLPARAPRRIPPPWLDDPAQRLATIFYTSGTTGNPKGVECAHAGYINLALSYADYLDLVPGMDATTLTSSLGYDGSISEMYSAWVSGCTVVLLTKEQVRSGPDLVPVLRSSEVTVLFCPPVLLTTLTASPEEDLPYPICRYIVPAGEAFPSALVEPWTRARRQIINTYGPTEASTDTSRQSLRPGEPITIGPPFPNVTYVILEIDQLQPLPHGEEGELCIGGVHLARGYRNLPEQTAQKFIMHPTFGRLYRTGDKCRIDIRAQQVHFLGRIDTQLKVRGHRVEAQAVEDILQTQFREIEAAVVDYQNETLVAFVAAPSLSEGTDAAVAPAPPEWAERVIAALSRQLPEPSVPTSIFVVEQFVMKPVSGKIDRKRLPDVSRLTAQAIPDAASPRSTLATTLASQSTANGSPAAGDPAEPGASEVLDICRAVIELPIGWDTEFKTAGGHSITIARLARRLHAAGWIVSVRSLLSDCNTARKIAALPRQSRHNGAPLPITHRRSNVGTTRDEGAAAILPVATFTTLQALFAALLALPGVLAIVGAVSFAEIGTFFTTAEMLDVILVAIGLYLLGLTLPFATLLWVMILKRALCGDFRRNNIAPGVYPKWSRMHLRVWCVGRMEALVLTPLGAMYRSAPMLAFALRRLGASVGSNLQCAPDAYLGGPLDLITIEDDVTIQTGAYIRTSRWSGEELHIGPIHLQSGCKISMRAAVAHNVRIGHGTWVTPFTPILADTGDSEMWEGAPARRAGRCTEIERAARACSVSSPPWLLEACNILMQMAVSIAITVVPAAMIAWLARDLSVTPDLDATANYFSSAPLAEVLGGLVLYALATTWLTIIVTSLLGCLFIRFTAAEPGLHHPLSLDGSMLLFRVRKLNAIQGLWTWTITGQYLRWIAGLKLRRLGASECDVMINLVPETARADTQVFWSNGSFTNMLDTGAHHMTLRHLDMPRNFFSGNNCVAEHGQLPTNFLLGVSTPCSDIAFRRQMRSRLGEPITVAGNPPVKFASASFEAESAAQALPGFPLFLVRVLLNDVVSMGLLRIAEVLIFAILFISLLRTGMDPIACAFAGVVTTESILVLLCVGVKKTLVGDDWGKDHRTPFWSWKHFAYFFAQDCFFVWCQGPLAFAAGTLLANPILRSMGCRIGPRTIVTEPMQCSDWNAVSFGSDCVVTGPLQLHTFENMLLKVKRTRIEDRCAIAFGATVMGGVTIDPDTTVSPLALVLKEMSLPTGLYEGSPAEPVTIAPGEAGTAHESGVVVQPLCGASGADDGRQ